MMRWLALLALVTSPALADEVGRVGVDWIGNDIIIEAVADPVLERWFGLDLSHKHYRLVA